MDLAGDLRGIIRGDVLTDKKTLETFSEDASIFHIQPELVVAPKDVADLKALVNYVSHLASRAPSGARDALKLSLTARAAGTDMSGGPLSESIVLDFMKYFNASTVVNKEEMSATTEPGVYYRDFERATLEEGLFLPCYTASKTVNAMGGMVANNSGGEKTLRFGKIEDYIMELNVVFSDGNEYTVKPLNEEELNAKIAQNDFEGNLYKQIYDLVRNNKDLLESARPKVHKNSAGYYLWNIRQGENFDLTRLLVGSQGTLGLITKAKLRLIKPKTHSALLIIFLKETGFLGRLINRVLEFKPESFESYDDNTLGIAMRYLPEMVKLMGAGSIFSLGWKFLPEMWLTLTSGMPKLILEIEFTGDSEEEVYKKADAARLALKEFEDQYDIKMRIPSTDAKEQKYWIVRRQSFALLRKHVRGKHTAPFIDDIIVNPDELPKFLPRLNEIMGQYDLIYTIAGHMGDGNFHIIPVMDYKRPDFRDIIRRLSEEVYDLVVAHGGSITAEHNDGLIRTPYLPKQFKPEVIKLFEETKHIFDPKSIFNPGKKVPVSPDGGGGNLDYALSHLKKS